MRMWHERSSILATDIHVRQIYPLRSPLEELMTQLSELSRSKSVRRRPRLVGAVIGSLTLASGVSAALAGTAHATSGLTRPAAAARELTGGRNVQANLFEWNWPSVAKECTTVLGPKGYAGVQVAPPQDSPSLDGTQGTPVHPWWEVYQPVDYNLTSRMGNEAQFRRMVATCRSAGVKVYVDAVINHMARNGPVSYGGEVYSPYHYDDLYHPSNFHSYPRDCPVPPTPGADEREGSIQDFNNWLQVTKCELLALPDLRTETNYVRDRIAGYLNKLIGYGVSGFRVDAAKHIGQTDLAAIESLVHNTVDGSRPQFALEVSPGSPGRIAPQAFEGVGTLLGFDFAFQIQSAFKSYTTPGIGNITDLRIFGTRSGLLPSDKELVFIENHDTERGTSTLSYHDGRTNVIATEFMLARGWGTPQVYAGFAFPETNTDQSPPDTPSGFVTNTNCAEGWVCTDRFRGVANMVGWHNYVGNAPLANWFGDRVNLIAFSRGDKGWIAINNHDTAQTHTFTTGLPAGRYCNIISGNYSAGSCSGPTVLVNSMGKATVTVPAKDSVAFDAQDLVRH